MLGVIFAFSDWRVPARDSMNYRSEQDTVKRGYFIR
jgi:hypothetical protein